MTYSMYPPRIVAYTFQTDTYCPDCITDVLTSSPAYDGWRVAQGERINAENNLDEIAAAFGINRSDEHSFDSGDFPKVCHTDGIYDDERCGACHELILP